MSIFDRYNFSKTLSVLNNPELVALISCSVCKRHLIENKTFVNGKCVHGLCEDCVKDISESSCPVYSCNVSVQPRDFSQHKVLGQVATHLDSLRTLIQRNKEQTTSETNHVEAADTNCENTHKKSEDIQVTGATRKSRNKENVIGELKKTVLDEATTSKQTTIPQSNK